jgi:hypothetical protein
MTLDVETDRGDVALRVLEGQTIPLTESLTPEEDRRILRKIDISFVLSLRVSSRSLINSWQNSSCTVHYLSPAIRR